MSNYSLVIWNGFQIVHLNTSIIFNRVSNFSCFYTQGARCRRLLYIGRPTPALEGKGSTKIAQNAPPPMPPPPPLPPFRPQKK